MKTDATGGASAIDKANAGLEERLSGRFAVELSRAEDDYPALRLRPRGAAGDGRARSVWPRLVAVPVGIAAILLVAVVGSPLLLPGTAPLAPAAGSGGPALGRDGIPTQIDGQRVYRVTDQAEWQNLSGSFLLGSYAVDAPIPCASPLPSTHPQSSAEADLTPQCGVVELVPLAKDNSEYFFNLAPRGLAVLTGWLNGPAVVMRVHAHDPEAAGCAGDSRAGCDSAVVVEAVVWPVVPTQIAGERVYRAVDQATFPISGSFLLAGLVTMPEFIPTCPMPPGLTTGEKDLIPYCYWEAIDGIHVAPKVDALAELRGRIVVARVHVNDAEAASCPVSIQAQCKAAVVVEDVVWTGAAVFSSPSASAGANPTPYATTPNAASSEGVGPVTIVSDGAPTTLSGQPVYRAANLPATATYLLGGKLAHDTTCPAPATPLAKPPACGFWTLGGLKVGTMVDVPEWLDELPIVAQIASSRVVAVCPGGLCTTGTLVITAIVWPVPPPSLPTPPAPLTPSP